MQKIFIVIACTFLLNCKKQNSKPQSDSVMICNQEWMTKNLDVSAYRNGDLLPQITDATLWRSLTTGAWCWLLNDSTSYSVYGKLYNWYAVNDPRGLAPKGWHIASDDEWYELTTCLGGEAVAGGKLKEKGTAHWIAPNAGATNNSGFTALPGGFRSFIGDFGSDGVFGYWWTSTYNISGYAFDRLLSNGGTNIYKEITGDHITDGRSVRCVKD